MEENVALDSTKQKKFDSSIKGIKKLMKKKDADSDPKIVGIEKVKTGRVKKRKGKERGLVYLSHIPHGFYENEMTQYFKQFGVVTNARVIKSKRTGRSKGHAFVEFKEPAVAEIVAETMNNYLMGKRLIKAAYIPPEKQKRKAFRKHWSSVNNPGYNLKIKMKKAYNENRDEEGELRRAFKLLQNINKTKQKLSELGINYDFFYPVDVPEALTQKIQMKIENEDSKATILRADNKTQKNGKKQDKQKVKKEPAEGSKVKTETLLFEKKKVQNENKNIKSDKNKIIKQTEPQKSVQRQKKQNLKGKGVTPIKDFIKVGIMDSNNESDGSLDFDSDEFDKMLQEYEESDNLSDDASNISEELTKQKVMKTKMNAKAAKKNAQPSPQGKKKSLQSKEASMAAINKLKFEKQSNQKARNKRFKQKK